MQTLTPNKLPISVFIITKDEEERLPKAIASVIDWVDEVIVVDSGSTDKTIEIANKAGCKTMFNEWKGFGAQKVYGEQQCRNNWILNIDADEEISPALQNTIKKLFENGAKPQAHAFKMHWKMIFFGQSHPPKFAVGSSFVRLYNKEFAGFSTSTVHDSVIVRDESKIAEIKTAFVYHRCFRSMHHWADKINYYSTLQAEDWVAKNRSVSSFRIIIEPFTTFLKSYFVRRYFLYGIDGFLGALMYAYARTLRLAKVKELYRLKNQS
jgi:glycosyltransferase involved in cell wall biosynthesis